MILVAFIELCRVRQAEDYAADKEIPVVAQSVVTKSGEPPSGKRREKYVPISPMSLIAKTTHVSGMMKHT